MDVQLFVVAALVILSAAYLAFRIFAPLRADSKTPAGCCGCSAAAACASLEKGGQPAGGDEIRLKPDPTRQVLKPGRTGVDAPCRTDRPFVA